MDWIRDHGWQTWLIAALLLAAAEMATLDFTLLMMAVGAGVGCLLNAIGLPVVVQVLGAVATAVALLAFVRPPIVRRLHRAPTVQSGTAGLVGRSALVLERVTAHSGRVKLNGEIWSARTVGESETIEPGSQVAVDEIDGATAVVHPIQ
jgi:membrane protein implicated in regulation of membrane protease activity